MTPTASHQALYRRWRAQTFAQIVGQEAVVETLRNAVRAGRVAHAILFVGPRGTGKTSLARILAKALNCTDLRDGDPCDRCGACVSIREGASLDVLEIDAASNRGINEVKELRERLHYAPAQLRRKVYILDEAHQITRDAWNALLKSLEEPPEFVVFMFASTHPQEFPPAILSRLQRYDVRRLTVGEIEGKLGRILEADGRDAEPAAVGLIARLAAGGMRDAESMLDQLLGMSGGTLTQAQVRDLLGLADVEAVDTFLQALLVGDAASGIEILDRLEERGRDLRVFVDQLVDALRVRLVDALSQPGAGDGTVGQLATIARRMGAIDPSRAGIGGLRLQLELMLFAVLTPTAAPTAAVPAPAPRPRAEPAGTAASSATPADPAPAPPTPPLAADPAPSATARLEAAGTADPGPANAVPTPQLVQAEQPAPAPVDGAPDIGDDFQSLQRRWVDVVARISQHPPTKPLIAACRPISVEGNVVTLGFPEGQAFLRDVAERRRSVLEAGLAEFLGRPVAVRCVATNLDLVPELAPDPDADFVLAEARRIFADDLADVGEVS